MALKHLREREKFIIWVAAILLIPSFILFFGTGLGRRPGTADWPVLRVDGEEVYLSAFRKFVHRMQIMGRLPGGIHFHEANVMRHVGWMLAQLNDARAAGLQVSDEEVWTFVFERFPDWRPEPGEEFDQRGWTRFLETRLGITPVELRRGVEERLLLDRYQSTVDSALISPWEAYTYWAWDEAQATYDEIAVTTAQFRDRAEEALADREDEAIAAYIEERRLTDVDLRAPGKWALEYILVPAPEDVPARMVDRAVEDYYQAHTSEYEDKSLDEVRDAIREKVRPRVARRLARGYLRDEVAPVLTELAGTEGPVTAERVLEHEHLERLTDKGIVTSGRTGPEPVTAQALWDHPHLGECLELVEFLKRFDRMTDAQTRAEELEPLRTNFNTRRAAGGEDFAGPAGAFKIRVVRYTPGKMRDPQEDADFRAELLDKVRRDKAGELARAHLQDLAAQIAEEDAALEDLDLAPAAVERNTEKLSQTPALAQPSVLPGVPTEVQHTADGYRILVLRERAIPAYREFLTLEPDERARYRQYALLFVRGGFRMGSGERMQTMAAHDLGETQRVTVLAEEE